MRKNIFLYMLVLVLVFVLAGCSSLTNAEGLPDPEKIVPKREILLENLEDRGYVIKTLTTIEGSDLVVDRVIAQNGKKFIDIVYGLSAEDASKAFEIFCKLYPDDYYILAQNGNYVYCIGDKRTFSKAGFSSLDNVGNQYIHN